MLQRHSAFDAEFGRGPLKSGNGDGVIERIVLPAQVSGLRRDDQVGPEQPQVVTRARAHHDAMFAETNVLAVMVDGGVVHCEQHQAAVPGISPSGISSVQTLKFSSVLGPNVVVIATSHASRPRSIRTRPMRGTLLRGSNVCQRPPIQASNHAAKSPTAKGGGVPTSLRDRKSTRLNSSH